MSRIQKHARIGSIVWVIGFTICFARRNPTTQLLFLPLVLYFSSVMILGLSALLTGWHEHRWRCTLPLVFCTMALVVSDSTVWVARKLIFAWSFPSYESVVRQMESGVIPVVKDFNDIPEAESQARLVYRVFAEKTDGVLTVEFLTEGAFPVKHSGYLYRSSGTIEPGSAFASRWPIRVEIKDKWFYVSN